MQRDDEIVQQWTNWFAPWWKEQQAGFERQLRRCVTNVIDNVRAATLRAKTSPRESLLEQRHARLQEWTHTFGADLKPTAGSADTFGDGMREAKRIVMEMLNAGEDATDGN